MSKFTRYALILLPVNLLVLFLIFRGKLFGSASRNGDELGSVILYGLFLLVEGLLALLSTLAPSTRIFGKALWINLAFSFLVGLAVCSKN